MNRSYETFYNKRNKDKKLDREINLKKLGKIQIGYKYYQKIKFNNTRYI